MAALPLSRTPFARDGRNGSYGFVLRPATLGSQLIEAQACRRMFCLKATLLFPALNCDIDVDGVDLDRARDAVCPLGGFVLGLAVGEAIQNNTLAMRAVSNQLGYQRDGLHGWVNIHFVPPAWIKRGAPWKIEDVRSVAPARPQPKIVDVRCFACLEDQNEFMFAAIEGPLTSVGLVPDEQLLPGGILRARRAQDRRQVPPVHEPVVDCAINAAGDSAAHCRLEKFLELGIGNLAGCHCKLAMANLPSAARVI